jgi:hypothetical protein
MTALVLTIFLGLFAAGVTGPVRALFLLREAARLLLNERVLLPTAAVIVLVVLLGKRYLDGAAYLQTVLLGTAGFVALFLLAERMEHHTARLVEWLDQRTVGQMALASALLSLAAGWLVLDGIPHVSDEVAYQFQAKAIALGSWSQPAPTPAASFQFIHTMVLHDRWFGIMNPGWPALLAIGYLLHAPWLMNPLLGGLALYFFHGFFREAGFTGRTTRLAILLLAFCPLLLFMNGTYMAHPANLALFGGFCWSWARLLRTESRWAAAAAGLCLALNLLVRPVDTVAVSLPFAIQGLLRLRRNPRFLPLYVITTGVGLAGVLLTLLYNRALTGDMMVMPMTEYFRLRNPGERFGMGFGADMGTRIHGAEWPGFYPMDAVRVSSYRLGQLLLDLLGLPLLPVAAMVYALRRRHDWDEWFTVMQGTLAALLAVYFFHFYHGIAYGSRHLYLAAPAVMLLLARVTAEWLERGTPETSRQARGLVAALVFSTLLFAYPPLVHEYGHRYRGVDGRVRDAVRVRQLTDAVVFVDEGGWGWKAAFPLNDYPLADNRVLFARDSAPLNHEVMARYPGRQYLSLIIDRDGTVKVTPLPPP